MVRRRIGERLVHDGVITDVQLVAGLRRQVIQGGRLGTNLIELFDLDLDWVAIALGRQHRLPPARQKHFDRVDPALQLRLPVELAARWCAVPIGRVSDDGRIAVAATDPLPAEALAELAAALGGEVMVAIAAELRVHYYLEWRYGLGRPNRLKRAPTHVPAPPPAAPDPPLAAPAPAERRRFIRVVTDSGVEPSGRVLARIPIARPPPGLVREGPAVADPARHEEVVRALRQATGREMIGALVVDALREGYQRCLDAALLLVVRDGLAVAWKGFVRGADDERVESLAVPLDLPSAMAEAWRRDAPYLGPPLAGALVEARLAEHLGPPGEVVVVPVDLGEGVVGLIYGHSRRAGAIAPAADALLELGRATAAALLRLVRAAQR